MTSGIYFLSYAHEIRQTITHVTLRLSAQYTKVIEKIGTWYEAYSPARYLQNFGVVVGCPTHLS